MFAAQNCFVGASMLYIFSIVILLASILSCEAGVSSKNSPQSTDECMRRKADGEVQRLALVVGNDVIKNFRLENAARDARLIASTFRELGFDVQLQVDVDRQGLRSALREFRTRIGRLCEHDIVVFYYAGNGFELGRMSYIATIDVAYPDKLETELETLRPWLRLSEIVESLSEHKGAKIIMIDTCRNYSLPAAGQLTCLSLLRLSNRHATPSSPMRLSQASTLRMVPQVAMVRSQRLSHTV